MSRKLALSLLLVVLGLASWDAMTDSPKTSDGGARVTHGGTPWPPE